MSIEDRLRAATRARAALVRDIRPLDLAGGLPLALPGTRQRHRMVTWMAPVTAAAVVVALAVALVSLRQARNGPSLPATAAPNSTATGTVPAPAAALPRYYAALDDPTGQAFNSTEPGQAGARASLIVGDIRTGKTVARFTPPPGQTFAGLTSAAGGTEFAVAAGPDRYQGVAPSPDAWDLLRVVPGSAAGATLTRLPVPGQPAGTQVDGIALSPNGTELAVLFQRGAYSGPKPGPLTLSIYRVPSGALERTWSHNMNPPDGFGIYQGRYPDTTLSWLSDGHSLAFDYGGEDATSIYPGGETSMSPMVVRLLNLTRPGRDLLANAPVFFRLKASLEECATLQPTTDGKTVVCGTYAGNTAKASTSLAPRVIEYSVATGKPRLIYQLSGAYELSTAGVLWASPDGSTVAASVIADATWHTYENFLPGDTTYLKTVLITKGTRSFLMFALAAPPEAYEIAF